MLGFAAALKANSPRARGPACPPYGLSEVFEVGDLTNLPWDGQTVNTLNCDETHGGRTSKAGGVAWFKVEDLMADRGNYPIDRPTMSIWDSIGQVVVQNGLEASATRREDGQDGQYPTYNTDLYFMPGEDDEYYLCLDP